MSQKPKFQSKSVLFGGKPLTLFSIDGITWSTRKDELAAIHERHEAQKVTAAHLRGEAGEEGAPAPKPAVAPKKKIPAVDPNRKFVAKYTHPAVAAAAAKKEREAEAVVEKAAPIAVAKAKAPKKEIVAVKEERPQAKKKPLTAAPKKRVSSKPEAKKPAGKKRAVA
jgi:hypothetical protein